VYRPELSRRPFRDARTQHSAARFEPLLSSLSSESRIALSSRGVPLATLALSQAD